ncbi:MAG: VanZ family protein [Bryobacteraceae bacterium]|nr:VanZ family protein [Bryobacteraceae bacterium]
MMRLNLAAKFFLAYAVLVLYLCLFPWVPKEGAPGPWFVWEWAGGRTGFADVTLNLLFFIPLGASGGLAFRGSGRFVPVALLCATLSFLIESLQGWLPGRVSSLSDLLTNTTGAILGCLVAPWLPRLAHHEVSVLRAVRLYPPAAVLAISFFAGQLFPFIPRYRLPHLRKVFGTATELGDGLQTFTVLLTLAGAAYLVRLAIGPLFKRKWCFLVMVCFLILRPLFGNAPFTGDEWAAAFLGSAMGALLPGAMIERMLAVLLPVAVILEEFRPFVFAAQPQPFGWVPFVAVFDISIVTAIHYFAEKFFFYGATIFFLARRWMPLWKASLAVIAILAAGEAAQRYLPGRTPETSDLALALAAWMALSLPGGFSQPVNVRERSASPESPH